MNIKNCLALCTYMYVCMNVSMHASVYKSYPGLRELNQNFAHVYVTGVVT
jgi:hypothetical protein